MTVTTRYCCLPKSGGKFGPGHATFFYSPDKTQLWICYHCVEKSNPSAQPIKRLCHCQRVYFDETGFPYVGDLVPENTPYSVPSENK
jgi:GH43 family beta-xylosidase